MNRYASLFARTKAEERIALGAFLMLGDPDREQSLAAVDAVMAAGADMLELGIPFTDPVADGPVIQQAAARALASGTRPGDAIDMLAEIRRRHPHIPIGVLTYANIVSVRGWQRTLAELANAGVDSLLLADIPAIEGQFFADTARSAGVAPVFIAAPSTPEGTVIRIAALSQAYVYCVARPGVTGVDAGFSLDHDALLRQLAACDAPPPVLGFGVARPEHVRAARTAGFAGVISGSAIVRAHQEGGIGAMAEIVVALAAACRG